MSKSKLEKWKSQLQEPKYTQQYNLIGRVEGYSNDSKFMYVSLIGGNKLYDGPELLAVSLGDKADIESIRIEDMADPESQAYKKPGNGGAIVELRSVRLTGASQNVNGNDIASAECLFFKGVLNSTEVKNQATFYPDTRFYTDLAPARKIQNSAGEERLAAARQTTYVFLASESKKVANSAELQSVIENHCQARLPGRNIPGVLLQASVDGESFSIQLDAGLLKEQQNINGEVREAYRPRFGKEAVQHLQAQPAWKQIEAMIADSEVTVVAVPSITSSASPTELKNSGNFDDNGQLTAKGQAVLQQQKTVDGEILLSKGVAIYRAVGVPGSNAAQPMRLHSTMPYAPGYSRYDNTLDNISTQHFTSNSPVPESASMAINRKKREEALMATSAAPQAPAVSAEPVVIPKEVEVKMKEEIASSAAPAGPEDDFDPDFGFEDELMPDFGDGMQAQQDYEADSLANVSAESIESDFDDEFDFSDELNSSNAPRM